MESTSFYLAFSLTPLPDGQMPVSAADLGLCHLGTYNLPMFGTGSRLARWGGGRVFVLCCDQFFLCAWFFCIAALRRGCVLRRGFRVPAVAIPNF